MFVADSAIGVLFGHLPLKPPHARFRIGGPATPDACLLVYLLMYMSDLLRQFVTVCEGNESCCSSQITAERMH